MKARLTIVEQVYHQDSDGNATPAGQPYSRLLVSDEQPFVRRLEVGPEWVQLPTGWLTQASVLLLTNDGPQKRAVNPTPEEREKDEDCVLWLGLRIRDMPPEPFSPLRLSESLRLPPYILSKLFLRCPTGITKVTITLLPS